METRVRIFFRYMAMRFVWPFLFGLGIFAILIFLGDLFDKMARLVKSPANFATILEYLWLEVPYWCIRIVPMATLLATLFAVSGFIQSGEWIAVQASGFETRRFFRPLFFMAFAVTVLSFAAQETVLPLCYQRAQSLWRDKVHPEWEWDRYPNSMLVGRPGQFITAKIFSVKEGMLERPVMDYYENGRVARQVDARAAKWDDAKRLWVFSEGTVREFPRAGAVVEKPFNSLDSDLVTPPKELVPRTKTPDEMSISEMRRYMPEVRRLGGSERELAAALQAKIAYPFSNLILCALGVPLALQLRRASKAVNFGAALGLSFLYVWVMEMGKSLGASGAFNPVLAAWLPHAVFGGAALWLYRGADV